MLGGYIGEEEVFYDTLESLEDTEEEFFEPLAGRCFDSSLWLKRTRLVHAAAYRLNFGMHSVVHQVVLL